VVFFSWPFSVITPDWKTVFFCGQLLMRHSFFFGCILAFPLLLFGQATGSLQGSVLDADSRRPLEAANVLLQGTTIGANADHAGSFRLMQVPPGSYVLRVSYIGYTAQTVPVRVVQGQTLHLEVLLQPTILPGQTIIVSAMRARERENPVAFATLSARDLAERYSTQDIPQLLSELPSTTFYSENGNGIGYNYLSIRGFDQRRISVMVNGIPQNDPEDHDVYWLDFPDLAANLQDIQVQRGAGSAFYGPPAIGGTVNLITASFSKNPGVSFLSGFGDYNTRKNSVSINSGLVGERYEVYGRISRIQSDGYRNQSWTDFSSYFLGAIRYDEHMTTQFSFYGGPIADHLAYYGISKADAYSHDEAVRTQNPIRRPEEIENFSQPHYELYHEWRVSDNVTVNNTFFLVTGSGFFDYDGSWAPYSYFRLTKENGFPINGDPDTLYSSNPLIRAFVDNRQYGWLPRVSYRHEGGELTVGAEIRIHRSVHWGALRWGQDLPASVTPDYHYYEYRGAKNIVSLFAQEIVKLNSDVTVQVALQYAYNQYRLFDEKYIHTDFSVPYHFFNPRLGINYNLTENLNCYTQISQTSREPRLVNLYNAAEASTPESWGPVTPQFKSLAGVGYDYSNPLVRPEALVDLEFGCAYKDDLFHATVNLFYMSFKDEIVKNGQLDRFGIPVTGNAERTLHQGIEISANAGVFSGLEVSANATLSKNRLMKYTVFDNSMPVSLDGNTIAGFPDFLANVRATYRYQGLSMSVALQHVGESYSDNYQSPGNADPGKTVNPFTVVNGWWSYRFNIEPVGREVEARVQVNNLFNVYYANHAEGDEFYPAALRNVFASLRFDL
jgi:iron complex outermembrane receptor protein